MDMNLALLDAQFKDSDPVATVNRIRDILAQRGIVVEEKWHDTRVPYCFALSIKLPGTAFSVNGKGLTREFARASGYGELMERLQLGFTHAPDMQKDGSFSFDEHKFISVKPEELITQGLKPYEALSQHLEAFLGVSMSPEALLLQYVNSSGNIPCNPCYELTQKKAVYFPNEIRMRVYGSNGCAAGNTVEEAIVQAISEIVERHHQSEIIQQRLTPPDVPEDVLRSFDTAYAIISYVRSKGYRVLIKDCSLGQSFPVVCACIISEKTGKYHTHFGAYPKFEIALERALTESFQGRSIDNIAQFEDLIYQDSQLKNLRAVHSEFTKGAYLKSPRFFAGTPSYPYRHDCGFSGRDNHELLKECVEYFADMGRQILVYNSACFGFPTCQVLIPGYSEVFLNRLWPKTNDCRYYQPAINALRDPTKATVPDMLGLLLHLEQMSQFTAASVRVHGFLSGAKLSADISRTEDSRLMAASLGHIYYRLGKYTDAVSCVEHLLQACSPEDASYLIATKRYLSMVIQKQDTAEIRRVLEYFHNTSVVTRLFDALDAGQSPFEAFTLHCDMKCSGSCALFGKCHAQRINQLHQVIIDAINALSFSDFSHQLSGLLDGCGSGIC